MGRCQLLAEESLGLLSNNIEDPLFQKKELLLSFGAAREGDGNSVCVLSIKSLWLPKYFSKVRRRPDTVPCEGNCLGFA